MGTNEADINNLGIVMNLYDQTVCISLNVEYNPVSWNHIRRTKGFFYVTKTSPVFFLVTWNQVSNATLASVCFSQYDFNVLLFITRIKKYPFWEISRRISRFGKFVKLIFN
jgi:hypothetical protein